MSPIPQQPDDLPQGAGSGRGEVPEDGGEPTEPDAAAVPAAGAAPEAAAADRSAADRAAAEGATSDGAAVEGEAAAGGAERGGSRGGSRTWRARLVGAVAAVLFAATATAAVWFWTTADRLAEEKAERVAVAARAGEFAVALQTYDYANLQAYRDQVFAISGEDFEKTYDEAFSPLEGVITSMRANSSASVRGVYVAEVTEGRAKAITVVDSQVTSTAGTRRMLGTYMELGLIKTGGEWKVNDATVMGAAEELVTDPNGKAVEPAPTPSPSTTKKDK
ncbi:hypothetical protein [Streptosporangium roseum]|uniref:Mce-associated membrane protein n=1 Tax=Streptosporangium roseum (strain ATCC 12428 / DSM 43021 / JCM 3005 / KCTC 9067 / NCIMB 10171 / NRRL 2505 / NI 9100) TaxID=479432 RepID=D2B9V6_STRRD|nr:hypothetical protein [Streptosporangium roseum]ACZ85969.1 hypothetical protein Sros_3017 [Streptosporangium roseum DSM 43021]